MKKLTLLILFLVFLNACQATKDALTLKKKTNSDEFLVEKKNPLVQPPEYGKLPVPNDIQNNQKKKSENKVISLNKESLSSQKKSDLSTIEKSIMKKIKKK